MTVTDHSAATESAYNLALTLIAQGEGFANIGRAVENAYGRWLKLAEIRQQMREAYIDARMQGVEAEDISPSVIRAYRGAFTV